MNLKNEKMFCKVLNKCSEYGKYTAPPKSFIISYGEASCQNKKKLKILINVLALPRILFLQINEKQTEISHIGHSGVVQFLFVLLVDGSTAASEPSRVELNGSALIFMAHLHLNKTSQLVVHKM